MKITGLTAQEIVTAVRSAFGAASGAAFALAMRIFCRDGQTGEDKGDAMAINFGGKHCDLEHHYLLALLFSDSSLYQQCHWLVPRIYKHLYLLATLVTALRVALLFWLLKTTHVVLV